MRTKLFAVVLAILLVASSVSAQPADPGVYVRPAVLPGASDARWGQGLTRRHGPDCFVVTLYHVIGDAPTAAGFTDSRLNEPVDVIGGSGVRGRAMRVDDDSGDDWIILQLMEEGDRLCAPWPSARAAAGALRGDSEGILVWRSEAGVLQQTAISVNARDETQLEVRRLDSGSFAKGMSGARVVVNGITVGILRTVEAADGFGYAHRIDFLESETARFFGSPFRPPAEAVALSAILPGLGQMVSNRAGAGRLWLLLTVAGTTGAVLYSTDVSRVTGTRDALGNWHEYTYTERQHPLRYYAPVIWLASGAASALEAVLSAPRRRTGPSPLRRETAPRAVRFGPDLRTSPTGAADIVILGVRF